jgi:DNA-directed RNA polymerase subunit RPC12/RpoP
MQYQPVVNVVLTKHVGALTYDAMPKGSYRQRTEEGLWVRCGDCGMILSCHHTVDGIGKVTPSIGCPECGWHVFAVLGGSTG